jgi:hypothetical protein
MANEAVGDNGLIEYDSGGSVYVALAKIYDISPNKLSVKEVETLKLNSAAMETQPGTPDYGEVTVTIGFIAASTTLINGWVATKSIKTFRITPDDSANTDSTEIFTAWVKEYEPLGGEWKKDETIKAKLTLRITGVPAFAAGS